MEFSTWDIVLTYRKALDLRNWGDGSVGNRLAEQTWNLSSYKRLGRRAHACDSGAGK